MTKLETDITATRASVRHWQRMRADRECGEKPGTADCALCKACNTCEDCPADCNESPYGEAFWAFCNGTDAEWHKAADAEIAYLQALLRRLLRKRPAKRTKK